MICFFRLQRNGTSTHRHATFTLRCHSNPEHVVSFFCRFFSNKAADFALPFSFSKRFVFLPLVCVAASTGFASRGSGFLWRTCGVCVCVGMLCAMVGAQWDTSLVKARNSSPGGHLLRERTRAWLYEIMFYCLSVYPLRSVVCVCFASKKKRATRATLGLGRDRQWGAKKKKEKTPFNYRDNRHLGSFPHRCRQLVSGTQGHSFILWDNTLLFYT